MPAISRSQSGALYLVFINPATSSFANVTGTATLNGLVVANFATGTYVVKRYTLLTAAAGVSGTFAGIDSLGLPAGFKESLTYDSTHAYLDLALAFAPPSGQLNINQQNVANAIVNFFNANGGIPLVFGGVDAGRPDADRPARARPARSRPPSMP